MSYTAPSGSTWQVTNNYDINPTSGYYRAYTGEFRGSPGWGNVPPNDIQQSCSLACDSKPDCAGWALDGNGKECYIISGNVKTLRSLGGRKAYVRTSARPTGKYATTPQAVTLGTAGGHYCQGDGWSQDGEGMEVDKQGGNRYCIENFPRPSRCPADIGTPVVANIVNSSGGAVNYQTGVNNTKVVCKYNAVSTGIMWNDGKMAGYFGGNSTSGATKQIRFDWCDANATFGTLTTSNDNCAVLYSANGVLDAKIIARIHIENERNWVDNQGMREKILSIAAGSGSSKQDAGQLITSYCLTYNPDTWVNNLNMRTYINNMYSTTQGTRTDAYLKTTASTIIDEFCRTHQTSENCACKNAINKQISGCVATPGIPGCAELKTFNDNLSGAPDAFNALIGSIRQSAKPICLSSACRTAATDPTSKYLRTADDVTLTCPDNINLCLSSIRVGGNISGNAKIVQDCTIAVNYTGANPNAPPPTPPSTTPPAPPPPPTGGLNLSGGAQAITQNAGKPNESTTLSATAATVTSSPAATPGSVTIKGNVYKLDDFLIKPGKSAFVDSNLETPGKQKGALGGIVFCLICCCCCLLLLMMMSGGGDQGPVGPTATNLAQERLSALLGKI